MTRIRIRRESRYLPREGSGTLTRSESQRQPQRQGPTPARYHHHDSLASRAVQLQDLPEDVAERKTFLRASLNGMYEQSAKDFQVDAFYHISYGRNVFISAPTGSGKTRCVDAAALLYRGESTIGVIICPLNALGFDQVRAKEKAGFTAVFVHSKNMNESLAAAIASGTYQFVYVSPEIFNSNDVWGRMAERKAFVRWVRLFIVDECHMVAEWGLRKNREKGAEARKADRTAFREEYDHLAPRLRVLNCPVLLMSATCTPQQLEDVVMSLGLPRRDIQTVKADPFQQNRRLIRGVLQETPGSCRDASRLVRGRPVTLGSIPPTFFYVSSRDGTRNAVLELHRAWNRPMTATSTLAQRYHGNIAEYDQKATLEQFKAGNLSIICATLALGLGIDIPFIRLVIQHDPNSIDETLQNIGRGGRDGQGALGVLLFRKSDEREFATTPVCLSVVQALYLQTGVIPMDVHDVNVRAEKARIDSRLKPASYRCSNCAPEAAEVLLDHLHQLTSDNFEQVCRASTSTEMRLALDLSPTPEARMDLETASESTVTAEDGASLPSSMDSELPDQLRPKVAEQEKLAEELSDAFQSAFEAYFGPPEHHSLLPTHYFDDNKASKLSRKAHCIGDAKEIGNVIGPQRLPAQHVLLWDRIEGWRAGVRLRQQGEAQRKVENAQKRAANAAAAAERTAAKQAAAEEAERRRMAN